jgi:hypothetical protein
MAGFSIITTALAVRSGAVVFSASCAVLLNFLRTRFMDRVGRKSETTLRITGLQFEISLFSGPATEQLKLPSGAPNAWHRQWGSCESAHAPAGVRPMLLQALRHVLDDKQGARTASVNVPPRRPLNVAVEWFAQFVATATALNRAA